MRLLILSALLSLSLSLELDSYKDFLFFASKNHFNSVSDYGRAVGVTQLDTHWEEFKTKFNRKYSSGAEEEERKFNFLKTIQFIGKHNDMYERGRVSHEVGVNEFADWSREELQSIRTTIPPQYDTYEGSTHLTKVSDPLDREQLPSIFDWRQKNKVTHVKNQGHCGSCWAFATIATIESAFLIKLNQTLDLSEQQLIDCCNQDNKHLCFGCGGGWLPEAMNYVLKSGVELETDYTYAGKQEKCEDSHQKVHLNIKGFRQLTHPSTEDEMMRAILANGPVAVFIDSQGSDFHFYKSGVMHIKGNHSGDHYVTIIGWGPDYWLIKNSWGTEWGENGFGRMARGVNLRGINNYVYYPVL